ncbi:CHAP domain-containing protein [Paenibacillus koleovorans]|uniref:CHAP domain-containing protein n=1 Tax=Paenibacillus koleovorans TaxID=121608 RepID=UPI000FD94F4E|nr:CHAP domain-containing protein [Paenibacillus koleovorans]
MRGKMAMDRLVAVRDMSRVPMEEAVGCASGGGVDSELAMIAGWLHNYYCRLTGVEDFPGINSAEAARPLLRDSGLFQREEIVAILQMVYAGGSGTAVDAPRRFSREAMANMAESLAGRTILGDPEDPHYRAICHYWPDPDIYKGLQNSWCAAFIYYCAREAGLRLPIRYPNGVCRFAGCGAWVEWAKLPETGFFYTDGEAGFTPERGDIVVYEQLLSEEHHDHIGIVLECEDDRLLVAEGNRDNENYSCVFHRPRRHCILGYIRIDPDYRFAFRGSYNPIL